MPEIDEPNADDSAPVGQARAIVQSPSHTPGPWEIWRGPQYEGGGEDICIGRGETWLANMDHRNPRCAQILESGHKHSDCDICSIDSGGISAEQLANARLIAAAPELLEVLMKIMDFKDSEYVPNTMFDRAAEAIRKATVD